MSTTKNPNLLNQTSSKLQNSNDNDKDNGSKKKTKKKKQTKKRKTKLLNKKKKNLSSSLKKKMKKMKAKKQNKNKIQKDANLNDNNNNNNNNHNNSTFDVKSEEKDEKELDNDVNFTLKRTNTSPIYTPSLFAKEPRVFPIMTHNNNNMDKQNNIRPQSSKKYNKNKKKIKKNRNKSAYKINKVNKINKLKKSNSAIETQSPITPVPNSDIIITENQIENIIKAKLKLTNETLTNNNFQNNKSKKKRKKSYFHNYYHRDDNEKPQEINKLLDLIENDLQFIFKDNFLNKSVRTSKIYNITLHLHKAFMEYNIKKKFLIPIVKLKLIETHSLYLSIIKYFNRFSRYHRSPQILKYREQINKLKVNVDILINDLYKYSQIILYGLIRSRELHLEFHKNNKLLIFWCQLFPLNELKFDKLEWNKFVDVIINKEYLSESFKKFNKKFQKNQMIDILTQNYEILTIHEFLKYVLEYESVGGWLDDMYSYILQEINNPHKKNKKQHMIASPKKRNINKNTTISLPPILIDDDDTDDDTDDDDDELHLINYDVDDNNNNKQQSQSISMSMDQLDSIKRDLLYSTENTIKDCINTQITPKINELINRFSHIEQSLSMIKSQNILTRRQSNMTVKIHDDDTDNDSDDGDDDDDDGNDGLAALLNLNSNSSIVIHDDDDDNYVKDLNVPKKKKSAIPLALSRTSSTSSVMINNDKDIAIEFEKERESWNITLKELEKEISKLKTSNYNSNLKIEEYENRLKSVTNQSSQFFVLQTKMDYHERLSLAIKDRCYILHKQITNDLSQLTEYYNKNSKNNAKNKNKNKNNKASEIMLRIMYNSLNNSLNQVFSVHQQLKDLCINQIDNNKDLNDNNNINTIKQMQSNGNLIKHRKKTSNHQYSSSLSTYNQLNALNQLNTLNSNTFNRFQLNNLRKNNENSNNNINKLKQTHSISDINDLRPHSAHSSSVGKHPHFFNPPPPPPPIHRSSFSKKKSLPSSLNRNRTYSAHDLENLKFIPIPIPDLKDDNNVHNNQTHKKKKKKRKKVTFHEQQPANELNKIQKGFFKKDNHSAKTLPALNTLNSLNNTPTSPVIMINDDQFPFYSNIKYNAANTYDHGNIKKLNNNNSVYVPKEKGTQKRRRHSETILSKIKVYNNDQKEEKDDNDNDIHTLFEKEIKFDDDLILKLRKQLTFDNNAHISQKRKLKRRHSISSTKHYIDKWKKQNQTKLNMKMIKNFEKSYDKYNDSASDISSTTGAGAGATGGITIAQLNKHNFDNQFNNNNNNNSDYPSWLLNGNKPPARARSRATSDGIGLIKNFKLKRLSDYNEFSDDDVIKLKQQHLRNNKINNTKLKPARLKRVLSARHSKNRNQNRHKRNKSNIQTSKTIYNYNYGYNHNYNPSLLSPRWNRMNVNHGGDDISDVISSLSNLDHTFVLDDFPYDNNNNIVIDDNNMNMNDDNMNDANDDNHIALHLRSSSYRFPDVHHKKLSRIIDPFDLLDDKFLSDLTQHNNKQQQFKQYEVEMKNKLISTLREMDLMGEGRLDLADFTSAMMNIVDDYDDIMEDAELLYETLEDKQDDMGSININDIVDSIMLNKDDGAAKNLREFIMIGLKLNDDDDGDNNDDDNDDNNDNDIADMDNMPPLYVKPKIKDDNSEPYKPVYTYAKGIQKIDTSNAINNNNDDDDDDDDDASYDYESSASTLVDKN